MLDLSPVKLLLVFIVAMILLGPDKLPQVARQLGAGWRKLQELRDRVDEEVRQNIPDLPSTQEIVRFARSPVTLLNQLADFGGADRLVEDHGAEPDQATSAWPPDPAAAEPEAQASLSAQAEPRGPADGSGSAQVAADPSMN